MTCNEREPRNCGVENAAAIRRSILKKSLVGFACVFITGVANAALPAAEVQALVDLYNSTGGPAWTSITDWATASNVAPTPVCSTEVDLTQRTIFCDATSTHVVKIDVRAHHLVGSLPNSLANLTELQTLQVSTNNLAGPMPSITGLSKLQFYYVYDNQLSGAIPNFSGMSSLVEFNAAFNQLTGPIPALNNLPALQAINLGYNQLGGTIPPLSGTQLPLLNYLEIDHNHIGGQIPDLTSMIALTALYVGDNRLTGRAPSPPLPSILVNSATTLCPNYLAATSSSVWDAATQHTPWYSVCDTDTIFIDGLEY